MRGVLFSRAGCRQDSRCTMSRRRLWTITLLAMTGCSSGFFTGKGSMQSVGPYPNIWKHRPEGCTRDPFDGLPVGRSRSILTLLWGNPGLRDPHFGNPSTSPDAPLRLEFMHIPDARPGAVAATLHTIDRAGILLDKSNCSKLELHTQEHPPVRAGGRPTISGQLELDCRANNSHLTATVQFERCEY